MKAFLILLLFVLCAALMQPAYANTSSEPAAKSDPSPAQDFKLGSDVATACARPRSDLRYFGCLGFVHGVLVGFVKASGSSYCNPKASVFDEAVAVEAYATQYPNRLSEPAARWIVEAALGSYPCHKQ